MCRGCWSTVYEVKWEMSDGYFEITDEKLAERGAPHLARFLIEFDNATHDNPSFGREKVIPGVAYIRSRGFRSRFGSNVGHWLVVCKGGERRINNLLDQIHEKAKHKAGLFFITSLEMAIRNNPLSSPIWLQYGSDELRVLITT